MAIPTIWAADSETDPFDGETIVRPFVWGIYNGSEYHEFWSTKEFVDFLRAQEKCVVYAHNGGKFDWIFLLEHINLFDQVKVISGRLASAKIGECELRDSMNIFPFALKKYEKEEFDYDLCLPENRTIHKNRLLISDYLKSDCVNLWNMMDGFTTQYGLHLTQASAAMKIWRKMSEIKIPESGPEFYYTFQKYYTGGRTEAFYKGEIRGDIKIIDINSAYPYAMKHRHAWGTRYETASSLPKTDSAISRAMITLKSDSIGAFPYRCEKGKLSFPADGATRIFHVTGWEFLAARDHGLKDYEIIECHTFSEDIEFNEYIDHFYDLKVAADLEGDKDARYHAKLFLNSLYGKMAAKPDRYKEYMLISSDSLLHYVLDGWMFNTDYGEYSVIEKELSEEKQSWYNVVTGASITGFVRAMLFRAIKAVDTPLYSDTDSIACLDTRDLEIDGTKLGAWDLEGEANYGAICGKKLYAFHIGGGNWKTASKGTRLTPGQIIRVARGNTVKYKSLAPSFSFSNPGSFIHRNVCMT